MADSEEPVGPSRFNMEAQRSTKGIARTVAIFISHDIQTFADGGTAANKLFLYRYVPLAIALVGTVLLIVKATDGVPHTAQSERSDGAMTDSRGGIASSTHSD